MIITYFWKRSGLYYKHVTIINDDSSIINKWRVSLTDDTTVAIYYCNMFVMPATGLNSWIISNL